MTAEIQQFKCPSCGHILGQQEHFDICQKLEEQLRQRQQEQNARMAMEKEQLKFQFSEEMRQRDEHYAKKIQEKEQVHRREIDSIVESRMKTELIQEELTHRQEIVQLENKHKRELEAMKSQVEYIIDEKIKQEITEKESKHRKTEEQYKLQLSRVEQYNRKLLLQVEEQAKRLERIPGELGGTAGENGLLEELRREFRTDEITGKKNGIAMADIVQHIVTERGERIKTPIVYDKKTSNKVTLADLIKAKNYRVVHNTDHCIIVTTDIKEANRYTEVRDGVLLVHPAAIIDVAKRIRSFLIETSKLAKINGGKDSQTDK
jgi:hypothetical protein